MAAPDTAAPRWVAIFDLDGTLTRHDTLRLFLTDFLRAHPGRWLKVWRLPFAFLCFVALGRDRGKLKSSVIRAVLGDTPRAALDACADSFVNSLHARGEFRPAALAVLETHRAAGDHLILLSASPDLYVPRIGRLLGFERTLCTEIRWADDRLDGALNTANRRGAEKSRCLEWLRTQYPDLPMAAYGNSGSDLEHMRHADRALLVNGNAAARLSAQASGIAAANWP